MNQVPAKKFDLENRTFAFAKSCRDFVEKIPKILVNVEYAKQLTRSSGSVAANYIEANEALSKKDFLHRILISRKEAKETRLWLKLCLCNNIHDLEKERDILVDESTQLGRIFGAIVNQKPKS